MADDGHAGSRHRHRRLIASGSNRSLCGRGVRGYNIDRLPSPPPD